MRITRRSIIRYTMLLATPSLALAACAPQPPAAKPAPPAATTPAGAAPPAAPATQAAPAGQAAPATQAASKPAAASGSGAPKTVVIAQSGDVTTFDANMANDTPTRNVHLNLFESPILRQLDGTFKPMLAESWENPDEVTWVFHIKKGIKFQNGYDLSAEDIKYTIERIVDPKNKSPRASYWPVLDHIEVPDRSTLIIKTKVPFPHTLPRLSGSLDVVSKRYYEEAGDERATANPIGTGPYKFKEWTKNQRVVLEANDLYWGGRPKIDTLIYRSIPEGSTRLAELLAGTVHLTYGLTIDQAASLEGKSGVKPVITDSVRSDFVVLDTTVEGPLKDVRVRQALNYAVDKEGLLKAIYAGHGTVVGQPLVPPVFGHNKDVPPYPYDPDKAKALLGEAGFGSGFAIDFETTQSGKDLAEAISLQLSKVGVNAKLQTYDDTTFNQRTNSHQASPMFLSNWLAITFDAEVVLTPRLSSTSRISGLNDPDIDAKIRAGAATIKPEERLKVYLPLMQELHDKAPWLYLWQGVDVYGASDKLNGWNPRPDSYLLFRDASLAD